MKCPKCGHKKPEKNELPEGFGIPRRGILPSEKIVICCPNCGTPMEIISRGKVNERE